jgi:hypothetical protein
LRFWENKKLQVCTDMKCFSNKKWNLNFKIPGGKKLGWWRISKKVIWKFDEMKIIKIVLVLLIRVERNRIKQKSTRAVVIRNNFYSTTFQKFECGRASVSKIANMAEKLQKIIILEIFFKSWRPKIESLCLFAASNKT